jgi:hypothetical protein
MKLAALAKGMAGKAAIAGMFIGENHPSWMANAVKEALRQKAQGVDPRDIWARTRTFTEHPGVPAIQEISDSSARWSQSALSDLKKNYETYGLTQDSFHHPRLFGGYQRLGQGTTSARIKGQFRGEYDPAHSTIMATGETPNQARSAMIHELQHGIQYAEGWPVGGNVSSMFSDPHTMLVAQAMAKRFEAAGMSSSAAEEKAAYETYRRLAGEAQAEAARARSGLTESQLTARYPGDDYPIPLNDLLIRRGAGTQAAEFPLLNDERLNRLLHDSSYTMRPDRAKMGLTKVNPQEFVNSTTSPGGYPTAQDIAQEAGRFDPYKFIDEGQHPYLSLGTMPAIDGHEGRHRLAALANYTDQVPVLVQQQGAPGLYPDRFKALANRTYEGQFPKSAPLQVGDVSPLAYATSPEELDQYLASVNVPLKDIGVSLKPVGPGWSWEEQKAYRNSIPFGRIPPPLPKE